MVANLVSPDHPSATDLLRERLIARKGSGALWTNKSNNKSDQSGSGTQESLIPKEERSGGIQEGLKGIFLSPFSLLLIFIPLTFLSAKKQWGDSYTFVFSFTSLLPLAKILGDCTEELAISLKNEAIAGILNATFGNFIEMMVAFNSLRDKNMLVPKRTELVKNTLLGSIMSNMLLVLGMAFFAGGIVDSGRKTDAVEKVEGGGKEQKFGTKSANVEMGMLLFCCMTFALPSLFSLNFEDQEDKVLHVSRIAALLVMSSYVAFLGFQMFTHRKTLEEEDKALVGDQPEEAEEEANLPSWVSGLLMMLVTVLTDQVSEHLCDSIEGFSSGVGIPEGFIGVILLPIAGNACEHLGAVRFAMSDKLALCLGIAIGSSTQVAMFVVPFSVLAGWTLDVPMDLNFGTVNTAIIVFAVLIVMSLLHDGRANWLKGYVLMQAYLFVGVMYWFLPPSGAH